MSIFINEVVADTVEGSVNSGAPPYLDFILILIFVLIFYFLIWRPQNNRAKEHKKLIESLMLNDEILISGGMMGRIVSIKNDEYVLCEISEGVNVLVQKTSVLLTLPKGTLDSLNGE